MKKGKTTTEEVKTKLQMKDIKKNSSNEVGHVIAKIKTKELELTIIWVIIILVFMSISLYITFSSVQKIKKYNTLQSGTLVTDYSELETGMGDVVTITSTKTYSDKEGLKVEPYEFKITNKSNRAVSFQVLLEDDNEMVEIDECGDSLLDKNKINFSLNNGKIKSLDTIYKDNKYILASGKIEAKSTKKYKLNIWATKENSSDKVGHYHGKIVVQNIKKEHE